MNAFDYFFEKSSSLEKKFLVGKEEISYKDLYRSSVNLASWIKAQIGTEKNILLISANNLFFLKAYLAILKSGNICIPLDPNIEKENYNYIANLTSPDLIFITPVAEKRLQTGHSNLFYPDHLPDDREIPIAAGANGEHVYEKCAEIIFTSGSTGEPKGVMISHKNLIANTSSIVEYLQLTRDDRMLVVLPFYYCYGLSLLHTHLRVGGSIVFNNSFIFLGSVLKDLIDHKCTGFAGVPSHFQILLRKSDSFRKTYFPDLKYVTQAGGKLAPIFIDEFREDLPGVRFVVMYGQTEATARLSWLPPEIYEERRGSIGKGIPGVELRVVNEKGIDVTPGETGEIIARGDNIMIGYFADKEGTANTLREGWLHTGDLGTVDSDGYIFLTARSKEMIKVRGRRISPKEIEAVILASPNVIDCTIEGFDHDIEGESIKAIVVLRKGLEGQITEEQLKMHCVRHLALYKVPQLFEIHDELTISATGKKIKKVYK